MNANCGTSNAIGPTATDKLDFENTYKGVNSAPITINKNVVGSNIELSWLDNALGEESYQVEYYIPSSYYSSGPFSSVDIVLIKGIAPPNNFLYSDRTIKDNSFSIFNPSGLYYAYVHAAFSNGFNTDVFSGRWFMSKRTILPT